MSTFEFPTPGMALNFARNARGRGIVAQVAGCLVTVTAVTPQVKILVRHYAGLPVKEGKR